MTTHGGKVTVNTLAALKCGSDPVTLVTAYDYPTAVFADRAGIDVLLVGDSVAMTLLGHDSTLTVTMTEMLVFARAVCRGATRALVIGDMPFLSYQPSDADAIRNAGAFITAGCTAVKCEGGARVAPRVRAMTDAGIAVMGHLGLTPQSQSQLGGYRVQGKTLAATRQLAHDARALEHAGAFAILIEAVPPAAAAYVRDSVSIPVYGIGAGPEVDGQLLISHDLLGTFVGDIHPRFAKRYAALDHDIERAFAEYASDVRSGRFPGVEHIYPIDAAHEVQIRAEGRLGTAKPASTAQTPCADAPFSTSFIEV